MWADELFSGQLTPAMLAFASAKKSRGYYAHERWRDQTDNAFRVGEIALNPDHLSRGERDVASTIVHEMCHHWQHLRGTPSRRGYHNKEWGAQMQLLGLMPSATGEPGGKTTGQKMTHYVIEGGPFARACEKLTKGALLPFTSGKPEPVGPGIVAPKARDKSKVPYDCSVCELRVWGKAGVSGLNHCGREMKGADSQITLEPETVASWVDVGSDHAVA